MNFTRLMIAAFILVCGFTSIFGQGTASAAAETAFQPDELVFPAVDGWRLGESSSIPGEDSSTAVNYDSPDRERMTVYVYSRGKKVGNELTGTVKDEFEGAKDALKTIVQLGMYSNLKIIKSDTAFIGGTSGKVKALRAIISFEAGGTKLNSEIYVFPYKGHVGKLRISRPASLPADGAAYLRLMAALDAFSPNNDRFLTHRSVVRYANRSLAGRRNVCVRFV